MTILDIKDARRGVVCTLENEFLKIKDATKEKLGEEAYAEWRVKRAAEIRKQQEVCVIPRSGS